MSMDDFRELLYTHGMANQAVITEGNRLSELGFKLNVECIIHEFEVDMFNGDIDGF